MKKLLVSLAAVFVLGLSTSAKADVVTLFQAPPTAPNQAPGGANQFDLDHYRAYTWSLRHTIAQGHTIVGARLIFTNISNWNNDANRLYVNLLDYARNTTHNGVSSIQDTNVDPTAGNGAFVDYFDGSNPYLLDGADHIDLTTLTNLTTSPGTRIYDFTSSQLAALNLFLSPSDNTLAFGFDPDCHYWNNGIAFEITTRGTTTPTPEPATMTLLGTGIAGLYYRRRRKQQRSRAAA